MKIFKSIKNDICDIYRAVKFMCTPMSKIEKEYDKYRTQRDNIIQQYVENYRQAISETHEEDEIEEQIMLKEKEYRKFYKVYTVDMDSGYLIGTDKYNIVNIINDINENKLNLFNIVVGTEICIITILVIILLIKEIF